MKNGPGNAEPDKSRKAGTRIGAARSLSGRIGEDEAARWMEAGGFRLLERNWRCREGELDIIAVEGGSLVVTEVRSLRQGSRFGTALESIDARKQHKVRKIARQYLSQKGWLEKTVRFDAAAVTLDPAGIRPIEVAYVRNAF